VGPLSLSTVDAMHATSPQVCESGGIVRHIYIRVKRPMNASWTWAMTRTET